MALDRIVPWRSLRVQASLRVDSTPTFGACRGSALPWRLQAVPSLGRHSSSPAVRLTYVVRGCDTIVLMDEQNLADLLAAAARDLGSQNVEQTLERSVHLAVELIDGCDACAITVVRRGTALYTPVSTGELPTRGDALQYELGEGPCMDAVWHAEVVISADLGHEERWPTWGRRVVADLGARSMMCIRLFADEQTLGALNMYSTRVNAFAGESDQAEGQALAAHVAVAFAAAQQIEGLNTALINRTVIGQAEGILMERFGISGDRAFQVLRRVSSHTNLKLHRVATELIETRQLPSP